MSRAQLALVSSRRRGFVPNPGQFFASRKPKEAAALMFSCAKVREMQSEAHGGSVSLWQRAGLWLHMRLCPPCAHAERALTKTLDLLRELGGRDTQAKK